MNKPLCLVSAMAAAVGLQAVEPDLITGPHEVILSAELLSQHVSRGREYSDEPTGRVAVAGRLYNLGVKVTTHVAVTDDEPYITHADQVVAVHRQYDNMLDFNYRPPAGERVNGGEVAELSLRVDYLIDPKPNWFDWLNFQIIPHYQADYNPYLGLQSVQEPHWIGVDSWITLPLEGAEVGGSFDWDMAGNHGWHASGGFRQFVQYAPVDMMFWQVCNTGDPDFHSYLTRIDDRRPESEWLLLERTPYYLLAGVPPMRLIPLYAFQSYESALLTEEVRGGVTTIEAGAKVTLPCIWEKTFVTLLFEGHWWLQRSDRQHLRDTFELILGAGIEFRFRSEYRFIRTY